jgi:hypothetical protein
LSGFLGRCADNGLFDAAYGRVLERLFGAVLREIGCVPLIIAVISVELAYKLIVYINKGRKPAVIILVNRIF